MVSTFSLLTLFSLTAGYSAQILPRGCSADNPVRAVRRHYDEASSFCKPYLDPSRTYYSYVTPPGSGPVTIYSYDTTTTLKSTLYYRRTDFSNVYQWNYAHTYATGRPAITYTDNKPKTFTNHEVPTPSYLQPYNENSVYTACTCVITAPTTSTVYITATSYVYVSPTATYTESAQVAINYPFKKYSVLCQTLKNMPYTLFKNISSTRQTRTISPIPKVHSREDCCQTCADTFNCLYWKHTVGTGECEYTWAIDEIKENVSDYDQCPNGYGGINGTEFQSDDEYKGLKTVYGAGTCGLYNEAFGENQSEQSSKEYECWSLLNSNVYPSRRRTQFLCTT